jgi:hypothetical protein
MPQQRYEVRGLKFISYTNDMAVSHRCTFAISLRLPSASYWVAHYLFLDDAGYSGNVRLTDPRRVDAFAEGSTGSQTHASKRRKSSELMRERRTS